LVMLSSVHNEKSYWGDPEAFRPERFIGPDGKLIKSEYLMAFGIGRSYDLCNDMNGPLL
jgi:methyl farnesoate epoxidase/farnesoate epoxidase